MRFIKVIAALTICLLPLAACGSGGSTTAGPAGMAGLSDPDDTDSAEQPGDPDSRSDADPSIDSEACEEGFTLTFCETFTITGAISVSGTGSAHPVFSNTQLGPDKCADFVGHPPTSADFPNLHAPAEPVGGHRLSAQWRIPTMPGIYPFDHTKMNDPMATTGQLLIDDIPYEVITHGGPPSKADGKTTLNPDGSGEIDFTGLINADSSKTISGSIHWTCLDAASS